MSDYGKQFKHPALQGSNAFRLIKDVELSNTLSKLSCVLESFALDSCPSYSALSYTWGHPLVNYDDQSNEGITIRYELEVKVLNDSAVLPIGRNLFEALSQLYLSMSGNFTSYLWVDSICIDQLNLQEREAQVALMGSIYGMAEKVIVWLGKDMTDFKNFEWFHRGETCAGLLKEGGDYGLVEGVNAAAPIFMGKYSAEEGIEEKWAAYCRFFEQRRWFTRAWIVQEVVLARNLEVLCGTGVLPWDTMVHFAIGVRISGLGSLLQTMRNSPENLSIGDEIMRLGILRESCANGGPDQEPINKNHFALKALLRESYGAMSPQDRRHAFLYHLLTIIRPFHASDLRDKIYSAVGIANRFLPAGTSSIIIPKYTDTVEEVYISAAKILLEKVPWLTALSMVEDRSRRNLTKLPSWVPDFSSRQGNGSLFLLNTSKPYNASCNRTESPSWFFADLILSLQGCRHDTIAAFGIPLSRISEDHLDSRAEFSIQVQEPLREYLEIMLDALHLCSRMEPVYINGQGRLQALWRTLIADQSVLPVDFGQYFIAGLLFHLGEALGSMDGRIRDVAESIMNLLDEFELAPIAQGDILITRLQIAVYFIVRCKSPELRSGQEENMLEQVRQNGMVYGDLARLVQPNRRLYTTRSGYIGVGPQSMQVNDEVWVVDNAKVPFVFRPRTNDTRLSLVGETYLHGFMHGEMLENGAKDNIAIVEIV